MRKINLKSILCLFCTALFLNNTQASDDPPPITGCQAPAVINDISLLSESWTSCGDSVALGASFSFSWYGGHHAYNAYYRVVTQFWRYDVGTGFCYGQANGTLEATVTSDSVLLNTSLVGVNTSTFYPSSIPQAKVKKSGYYVATSYLQHLSGSSGIDTLLANQSSTEWTRDYYLNGVIQPDHCCFVAPYVEIAGKNQDSVKSFSVNDVVTSAGLIYITPRSLVVGQCHDLIMHNIGGNSAGYITVYHGTYSGTPIPTFHRTDSAFAYFYDLDINHKIPDVNLSDAFGDFIDGVNNGYIQIRLTESKNACDAGTGEVSRTETYLVSRPSTPTVGSLKVNNTAVPKSCTTTFTTAQQFYACNPIMLTFTYNTFDSVTISTKKYTICNSDTSLVDSVKQYTSYPSGGIDLREVLTRSSYSDLSTVMGGTYKVSIRSRLCNSYIDSIIYIQVNSDLGELSSCFKISNVAGSCLPQNYISPGSSFETATAVCGQLPKIDAQCSNLPFVNGYYKLKMEVYNSSNVYQGTEIDTIVEVASSSDISCFDLVYFTHYSPQVFYFYINSGMRYKITWTVGNICGESSSIGWIYPSLSCKTDGSEATTGINDVDENTINIYPNPSADIINVELPQNTTEENNIVIQTIDGRIVNIAYKKENNVVHLDFQNYQSGVYLLNITVNQKRFVRKLIIE